MYRFISDVVDFLLKSNFFSLKQTLAMNRTTGVDPDNSSATFRPALAPMVSADVLSIIMIAGDIALSCPVSVLGVFTYIVNIIVYSKMGFSESFNIHFLTLSCYDLLVSIFSFLTKLFYSRFVSFPMFTVDGIAFLLFIPLCGSTMMTALISMERCICVVFPLKVKNLIFVLHLHDGMWSQVNLFTIFFPIFYKGLRFTKATPHTCGPVRSVQTTVSLNFLKKVVMKLPSPWGVMVTPAKT